MKKPILLFAALLLTVVGAQATDNIQAKTLELKFSDSDFRVSYSGSGTNSVVPETGELSLTVNATCAWDRYWNSTKYDLSASDFFVVKLKEAATQDLYVLINQKGFWDTVGVDEENADHGIGYMGTLKAGDTELRIRLAGLKSNMTVHNGTALNLSDIWMINLWTGGAGGPCTYKIEEIYAEAVNYDQVVETPIWNNTSFSWEGEGNAIAEWGGDGMTIDRDNKTITKNTVAWVGNNAVSWLNNVETDISGYDRLVLELNEASTGPVEVVVSDERFWGRKCHSAILASGETKLTLTLSELKITGTPKGEDTWKTGDPLDLERVNLIFIRTDNGTANQVVDVKDFYFATAEPSEYSLIRKNTTAGTYGTICLPFAASKPRNANVYDVVGWDDSNVYLSEESVESLEAGKAYVFKSSDANDITFTKTGTEDNLTEPTASTNMLHGQFSGSATVPVDSHILKSGQWKKVVGNTNTVKNYRAYLTLDDNMKVPEEEINARDYVIMNLGGDGGATGISLQEITEDGENAGMKDGKYFENGKIVIVKNGVKYSANGQIMK